MIEGLQYFFDFILFSLGEPAVAIIVALVFYFGRVFGRWTRSFNVWKYLALGYFGILIFRPLEELGIIFGGVFILGAASMYLDLFRGIFSWAGGITDVFSALRSRSAYEDIRRLEREIEALKSQLRASQTSPAAPGGSTQQASWRAQAQARKAASAKRSAGTSAGSGASSSSSSAAGSTQGTGAGSSRGNKGRRPSSGGGSYKAQSRVKDGPTGGQKSSTGRSSGSAGRSKPDGSQSGSRRQGTSQSQSRQQSSTAGANGGYQISSALRDKYLQTLELIPGKAYTQAELKVAWRKMAFKTHPDKGGSAAAFSAVQEAYKALT